MSGARLAAKVLIGCVVLASSGCGGGANEPARPGAGDPGANAKPSDGLGSGGASGNTDQAKPSDGSGSR